MVTVLAIVAGLQNFEGGAFARAVKPSLSSDLAFERREAYGRAIVAYGAQYLGTPYRFGGADIKKGIDTSNFVAHVFDRAVGLKIPPPVHNQETIGEIVWAAEGVWHRGDSTSVEGPLGSLKSLHTGDRLIYQSSRRVPHHTGIYIRKATVNGKEYRDSVLEAAGRTGVAVRPISTNRAILRYVLRDSIPESFRTEDEELRRKYGFEIVKTGLQFLGTPYKLGGTSLTKGIDTSNFVEQVMRKATGRGVAAPVHNQEEHGEVVWAAKGKWHRGDGRSVVGPVGNLNDLKTGDRLIYIGSGRVPHHTGFYISAISVKGSDGGDRIYKHAVLEASGSRGVSVGQFTRNQRILRYVLRDPIPSTFQPESR